MTAKDYLKQQGYSTEDMSDEIELMIGFAEYHVNLALKAQKDKLNELVEYGAINKGWQVIQEHIKDVYKDKIQ